MKKKKTPTGKPVGRPKGSFKHTDEIQLNVSFAQLDPVDRAMLTIVLAKPAILNSELARQMGMRAEKIKTRRDRGIFQTELARNQRPAIERCREAQREAANVIIDLLRSPDEKIRLEAAKTLLKPLLPSTAIIKHEAGANITLDNMTIKELDLFIAKGLNGLNEFDIIDIEPIEQEPA